MKIKQWWSVHKPTKRRLIQLYAALLFNANLKGFATGRIYQGPLKSLCTPGLNCYSCPAATGACPLGALQNALADSGKTAPYYVVGILLLYGLLFGRWICGFLCPFGLIQDLLHKIKTPKLGRGRVTRVLSCFKYVLLGFLVVLVPLALAGVDFPLPAFCKYVCPAGTLEGAVGLLANPQNESMLGMLGGLFTWKFLLLVFFVVGAVFVYRFFCRFFCPLGAIYGLFNKISFVGVKLDKDGCVDCGRCAAACKMDIRCVGDRECIQCGECIGVCPTGAIQWKGPKILLPPQAIGGEIATKDVEGKPEDTKQPAAPTARGVRGLPGRTRVARAVAWGIALAVLAGSLFYFNFAHKDNPEPVQGSEVGDICRGMDLEVYNGGGVFNAQDQLGRVTVINFWGTWCGPCIAELPYFDEVAEDYGGRVTVVAVHSDYKADTAAAWIAEHYPDSSVVFAQDAVGGNSTYYTALGGEGDFPMTLIVGRDGVITFKKRGSVTREELFEAVEEALG